MSQVTALLQTLKRELKARGITYADVAGELGLSESSVKRLFSESKLSLDRLEALCQIVGLDISDLVQVMMSERKRINRFKKQLPDGLDLIARALKAGHAFTGGMSLAAEEFDGVIVCAGGPAHPDLACLVLEAGLPVLLEKPAATEGKDFYDTGVALVTGEPVEGVESISVEKGLELCWG